MISCVCATPPVQGWFSVILRSSRVGVRAPDAGHSQFEYSCACVRTAPRSTGGIHTPALYDPTSAGNYSQGQTVDFTIHMNNYHGGDFMFRICKIEGTSKEDEWNQLTEECFAQHELSMPSGEKWFRTGWSEQQEYYMTYKLPDGLTCDGYSSRCVLQWYWLTSNTCIPPGEPAELIPAQNPLGICGITHGYPEEVGRRRGTCGV